MPNYHYGRIPDLGDKRDRRFSLPERLVLPSSVDLRPHCPEVEDQQNLGSCTSFATGSAVRFARKKQGVSDFPLSHLFLYYNSRRDKNSDTGAMIRDAIKAASKQGDCPEKEWPYDISKFTVKPPVKCYKDALTDRALSYLRISQSLVQMKSCLAQGFPFVAGISVYESFESEEVANTGVVPLPGQNESLLGGHAVLCCAYSDAHQRFTFLNSWSSSWGDKGYFTLPYAYLQNSDLASDFWTIRMIG